MVEAGDQPIICGAKTQLMMCMEGSDEHNFFLSLMPLIEEKTGQ